MELKNELTRNGLLCGIFYRLPNFYQQLLASSFTTWSGLIIIPIAKYTPPTRLNFIWSKN